MGGRGTNQYRIFAFGSLVAVATALAVAVAPAGEATSSTCRAANLTSGAGQSQNLQRLIDSASPGDEIRVKGVCVGNLLVDKDLALVGKATEARPTPTLRGNGRSAVLRLKGDDTTKVTLSGLTITGGVAKRGGGIHVYNGVQVWLIAASLVTANSAHEGGGVFGGTVVLQGSSAVTENTATFGGGLARGVVTINDTSSVSGNIARHSGGGIQSNRRVTLNGASSVSGNRARYNGGGIFSDGIIRVNDSSSIAGNTAGALGSAGGGVFSRGTVTVNDLSSVSGNTADYGGGIYNDTNGTITVNDASSVTGNTALNSGGGISNFGSVTFGAGWVGTVCGNDPDDWPGCQP